jgi:chromosomal replication initiator protein
MILQSDNPPSDPFLTALRRRLSKQAFETWFQPLTVSSSERDGVVRIAAPNTVVRDWIMSTYATALDESLLELRLDGGRIEWMIPRAKNDRARNVRTVDPPSMKDSELDSTGRLEATPVELPSVSSSPLNERYTFDTFVVASCNRFAHAAARAVAEAPGKTYNPLYLYGGVGLGKTHLVQATGQAIKKTNPKLQVAYVSLERFMNELINAIRYGYDKTHVFRERYRSIDVLLIDDIQFIRKASDGHRGSLLRQSRRSDDLHWSAW